MKSIALILPCLALSLPARADVTVEYRTKISPPVEAITATETIRIEMKADRCRVVTITPSSEAGSPADTSIEVIRLDKHLRWAVDSGSRSYCEYPWPDTQRVKEDDWTEDLKATGERDTIDGRPVEHVIVTRTAGGGVTFVDDVWLTRDVPHYEDVARQCKAFRERLTLAHPLHPQSDGWPAYTEKIHGLTVRTTTRTRVSDPKAFGFAEDSYDAATGMVTMEDSKLTLLSQEPIDKSHFEPPPGYQQAVWVGAPQPREQLKNKPAWSR